MSNPLHRRGRLRLATTRLHRFWRATLLVMLGLLAMRLPIALGDVDPREPVPAASAQAAAEKSVRALYKSDFARRDPASCSGFAGRLLEVAQESGTNSTERFVFLKLAQDVADGAGDVPATFRAVETMTSTYAVDTLETRLAALKHLAGSVRTPETQKKLADAATQVATDASAAERATIQSQAIALATAAAERSHDQAMILRTRQVRSELDRARDEQVKAQASLHQLELSPEDPAANLAVGHYRCMMRGEWEKGLPYLARGADPALQALAKRDLAAPTTATEMAAIADAWWDYGAKSESREKRQTQAHAAAWYGQAMEGLSGLRKLQAQRRIDEATQAATSDPGSPASAHAADLTRPDPTMKGTVKILQATYGVPERTADLTDELIKAQSKDPFLIIDPDQTLGDPAQGAVKTLRIRYTIAGKPYDVSAHDYETIVIPAIPAAGIRIPGLAPSFRIVAARFGVGLKWYDVTDVIRQQVKDPHAPVNYAYLGPDIADGVHKHLVIWFDDAGRRFCTSIRDDEVGTVSLIARK